jgi:hypothetical protein
MATTSEFSKSIRSEMARQLAVFAVETGWSVCDRLEPVQMTRGGEQCVFAIWDPASLPIRQRYQRADPAHPQAIVALYGPARELRELGVLDPADDVAARVSAIILPFLADLDG